MVLLRLRTLEVRYKTRFDWVVMDAGTAYRFIGLHTIDDGKRRAVVAQLENEPDTAERFVAAAPSGWIQVNAHRRHVILVKP